MTPDRALVNAVLARAPGAFERLVREHQALCWHVISRLVRDAEDTRDLCQETFLRVHGTLAQFRYESALKTWIARIAYSIALRHLERKRLPLAASGANDDEDDALPASERVADDFDLEAAWADAEIAVALREAIEALPAQQRLLLTLYHLDELGIPEIAQITALPPGTIKSYLFRARLRLRDVLQPTIGDTR
jgi:RNA polymerase sigma factor (sigma-70 family)